MHLKERIQAQEKKMTRPNSIDRIDRQIVERKPPCKCGSEKFREASRIADPKGGRDSVMFECAECGEYRLG